MTKWNKLFGLDHPEAYGKIEDPEDNEKHLYASDVPDITTELLVAICKKLNIDTTYIWNRYAKTPKEHRKENWT
jgi:hypothetical protein